MVYIVFVEGAGDRLDLHVLTHSFPTRRAADLEASLAAAPALAVVVGADGRIAPPERLTGWLGLTDRPRYLSELGTSETGLSDDDLATLIHETSAAPQSGRGFDQVVPAQGSDRPLMYRRMPAPVGVHRSGSGLPWVFRAPAKRH